MNDRKLNRLMTKYLPDWQDPGILRRGREALVIYFTSREKGNDHKWALMCALQKPPGSRTEREFFAGRHTLDQQFRGNERQLNQIVSNAKAAGYRPNASDVYEPGLAAFPGDPRAFIPSSGGLTYVRQQCEARGLSCQGDVKIKGRGPQEIAAGALAPDLVNEIIDQQVRANPDLARVDRRDLAAEAQARHGFTDDKRAGQSSKSTEEAVTKFKPQPRKRPKKPIHFKRSK